MCGPLLRGEALTGPTVRDEAVVWEAPEGVDATPQLVEPILAQYHVPVGTGLVILVTDAGVYVTSADEGSNGLPVLPL